MVGKESVPHFPLRLRNKGRTISESQARTTFWYSENIRCQ